MTRLGKFLATNILTKVAQILGDCWGYFEKHHLLVKTFAATFGKNSAQTSRVCSVFEMVAYPATPVVCEGKFGKVCSQT